MVLLKTMSSSLKTILGLNVTAEKDVPKDYFKVKHVRIYQIEFWWGLEMVALFWISKMHLYQITHMLITMTEV